MNQPAVGGTLLEILTAHANSVGAVAGGSLTVPGTAVNSLGSGSTVVAGGPTTGPAAVAGGPTTGPGVVNLPLMTPAARAAVLRRRQEARKNYDNSINDGWSTLYVMAQNISKQHHKALPRVERDLHLARPAVKRPRPNAWNAYTASVKEKRRANGDKKGGRDFLINIAKEEREAYLRLTPEEKTDLAKKHEERRVLQNTTRRLSGPGLATHVASTMKNAQEMFLNLNSRTGVEVMVYAVPGTTDLPMKGVAWSTDGVKDFMPGTMKLDPQDVIGKMEGHVVHGLKGAAENYVDRKNLARNELRQILVKGLRAITQNPSARIEYVHYWVKVVRRYLVILEGWPDGLDFKNLNNGFSLTQLNGLKKLSTDGLLYWRKLTQSEFDELDEIRERDIAAGTITPPNARRPRSDRGVKRKHAALAADDEMEVD